MKPSINLSGQFCPFFPCSFGALEYITGDILLPTRHSASQNVFLGSQSEFSGELLKVQPEWTSPSGGGAQESALHRHFVVLVAHARGRDTVLTHVSSEQDAHALPSVLPSAPAP